MKKTSPHNAFNLTSREFKCMIHCIFGISSKEIAIKLNISHRTVENHLHTAKLKLGIPRRSLLLKHFLKKFSAQELLQLINI